MGNKTAFLVLFATHLHCIGQDEWETNQLYDDPDQTSSIELNDFIDKSMNKFNINSSKDRIKLTQMGLLSFSGMHDIDAHILFHGKLNSISELRQIVSLEIEEIKVLQSYLTFSRHVPQSDITYQLLTRAQIQTQLPQGIDSKTDSSGYIGSPHKFYARQYFSNGRTIQFGSTHESDYGEKKAFPDFNSFFLKLNSGDLSSALLIGDYNIQVGQGLLHWNGGSFGKSTNITSIYKSENIFTPYKSVDENRFCRGAAFTHLWEKVHVDLAISKNQIDSNLDSTGNMTSLYTSGDHSSLQYLLKKDQTIQETGLIHIAHSTQLSLIEFSGSLNRLTTDQKSFNYAGMSLAHRKQLKQGVIFGEVASNLHTVSIIENLIFNIENNLSISFSSRKISEANEGQYHAPVSNSLGSKNETGFFTGIAYQPTKKVSVDLYVDRFKYDPYISTNYSTSSKGIDIKALVQYSFSKSDNITIRLRYKTTPQNTDLNDIIIPFSVEKRTFNARLHGIHYPNKSLRIQGRIEACYFHHLGGVPELGWMAFLDFNRRKISSKFSVNGRITIFDTPSFDSRIYAYENDLLYVYSVPFYYEQGISTYFNVRWKINKHFSFWLKAGRTSYLGKDEISSGLHQIDSGFKNTFKVQMRYKL